MRNKERIRPVCAALEAIWSLVPDWRLTQLMFNAMKAFEVTHECDSFYAEDDEFIKFLGEYMMKVGNNIG